MKKLLILILQFLIFSLFSCGNLVSQNDDSDSSGFVVARGTILVSDEASRHAELDSASIKMIPNQFRNDVASRQAFPSAAGGTLYYTLTCTNGTLTYNGTVDSSSSPVSYSVQVPAGSSTITAEGFLDEAKSQKIYEGSLSLSDVTFSSDLSNKTIILNDIQSGTNQTATVSLPILIDSGVTISKIKAEVSTSSTTTNVELPSVTSGKTYYFTLSEFSETAASSANAVPGVYDVVFDFYAEDSSSSEYLAFQTNQKISASNYLSTSSWTGNGADSCINSSGILEITKTLCGSFLSTIFYIDSSNGSDTIASGSFSSPFKSIQKAVNVIKSRGTTDACTIYLKSDITASDSSGFTNGSLVEIADSANLNLKIKSYPSSSSFTIDGGNIGRIFYVGSGNSLTVQNLTLQNGKATDASAADTTNGAIISGNGFTSLELNKVSITSEYDIDSDENIVAGSNGYGISVNKSITLSGICTFDATFYLSDSATISFSSTYANVDSLNSGYVNIPESNYVEDAKILEGENLSTSISAFSIMKKGWNIDISTGCLKQNRITHSSYTADGTNVIALTSSVTSFESGKTYLISDKTALSTLAALVNDGNNGGGSNFVLTANIDLGNSCPGIGNSALNSFNGTFDGNNYCIYNLSASSSRDSLFKYLGDKDGNYSVSVKNLRVKGSSTVSQYSGGIAANTYGSVSISNCISDVNFSPSDSGRFFGGFVGYINDGSVEIKNCVNNGNVTTACASDTAAYVAGFVGNTAGSSTLNISNCVNNGNVSSSTASNCVAGFSNGEQSTAVVIITYCVNNGTITSSGTQIGAFTGDSYSTISNSMYYIPSGSSITAKYGSEDTNLTKVSSFSTFSSSLASTMNSYISSGSSYISWTTNTSGHPDLSLHIEDSN